MAAANTVYAHPERYERQSPGLPGDVAFYLALAREARPPVLELGCGTGRLALPIARAGIATIGIDNSPQMLAVARARGAGVPTLTLVEADMRAFSLPLRLGLVFIAYRGFMHLLSDSDQRACLGCVFEHLLPGGRFALNIVNPVALGVGPGCPTVVRAERGLRLRYVFASEMDALLRTAGFELESLCGSFDGRMFNEADSSEMVWVAVRP